MSPTQYQRSGIERRCHGVWVRACVLCTLGLFAASCETLGFYWQAASGQWSIVHARRPTAELIASKQTDPRLRDRLLLVDRLLHFAKDNLALEPGKSYASFVRIDREDVVWNVFATPEFSTRPLRWCYPVVGCASYRGYFHQRDAERYSQRLMAAQRDVIVAGVAAYSTLGWFNDPVLSTFVSWPDADLAELIFHELAHARVFVSGDTPFNEGFAEFVARRGVLAWLHASRDEAGASRVMLRWQQSDRFVAFALSWRDELQRLYDQPYNAVAMSLLKTDLYAAAQRCYLSNEGVLGDHDLFVGTPNNARLVPLAAYHELRTAFAQLFAQSEESWPGFYASVARLGRMNSDARASELMRLRHAFEVAHGANSQHIRCESLRFEPKTPPTVYARQNH